MWTIQLSLYFLISPHIIWLLQAKSGSIVSMSPSYAKTASKYSPEDCSGLCHWSYITRTKSTDSPPMFQVSLQDDYQNDMVPMSKYNLNITSDCTTVILNAQFINQDGMDTLHPRLTRINATLEVDIVSVLKAIDPKALLWHIENSDQLVELQTTFKTQNK